jgi:hypothetical protein
MKPGGELTRNLILERTGHGKGIVSETRDVLITRHPHRHAPALAIELATMRRNPLGVDAISAQKVQKRQRRSDLRPSFAPLRLRR